MAKICFGQYKKEMEVEEGSLLIDVIRKNGFNLETPCNSKGVCGKCKVKVYGISSKPSKEELPFLNSSEERLACMTRVSEDIKVEFFINEEENLKTINEGYGIEVTLDSRVYKEKLLTLRDKTCKPYIESLNYKISDMDIIRKLGELEKIKAEQAYTIAIENKLIDIIEEDRGILGVAIDIGTTGVSAYLLDLEKGDIINKTSALNPQTLFGGDVISRISFSMQEEDGLHKLQEAIVNKINEIIKELLGEKLNINQIYHVSIAANTTMLHMLAGINPEGIAKSPYRAIFLDSLDLNSRELGININSKGIVTLLPSASSYIGADIVAGIVAIDIMKYKSVLFIDIGTNGEMVLLKDGKLFATSTAAGPALEGMNISCGMRAEKGAIEAFSIDQGFNISYSTIGNIEAKGICGSGLLDITAALISKGILEASGRFSKKLPVNIEKRFKDKKFYITEEVYISQKDIRQIQLAKGAIASGVNMLLKELNSTIEDIKHVIIAGAFGYHLKEDSIRTVGIIPKGFNGDVNFVGNSSVEGAKISLLNKNKFLEMVNIKNKIEVVDLSNKDYFQKYFIEALNFN